MTTGAATLFGRLRLDDWQRFALGRVARGLWSLTRREFTVGAGR